MTAIKTNKPNELIKKSLEARPYQLELLEYVTQRNAIIYLPTGAGKTFIAIMALRRYAHEMQNKIDDGGKRAIFMCNTVELARQQALEVKKNTNLKVGFYVGERAVDNWSRNKWNEEIAENQVLIGTSQIFLDIVMQNFIKITDLSLVIVDECHHANKAHPMREFLSLFQHVDQSKLPRVVGLTGVLLKGNKLNNIPKELSNLEATFRGNIVTVSSLEEYKNVMLHSTQPNERVVLYESISYSFPLVAEIKSDIDQCNRVVEMWDLGNIPVKLSKGLVKLQEPNKKKFIRNLLDDFVYQMEDFGLYAAAIAIMSPIIELELKKRQSETIALRKMYRFVVTKCEQIRHKIMKKLNDMMDEDNTADGACHTLDVILNFSTPKLRSLLLYVKSSFAGKKPEDISCLVFVDRRYSAKCLYYVLKKFAAFTPELADVVKPEYMVGRNSIAPGIECILDRKWHTAAINKFRSKECNVIICSSVLEEGIDIQACNYVLAFDPLKTFNSYIQTKGRARSGNSIYAIFTTKINQDAVIKKIRLYQETHELIKEFLIGRVLDREDPKEEAIANQFCHLIPPFKIPSGACLLANSSLSLISRYCQMLPGDIFTVMPWFCKVPSSPTDNGKVVVSLKLPLQSALKDTILSDPMANAKLAKISAAFKACMKLYELGELNDRLMPVTKQECIANVSETLFPHWKKHASDVEHKKPGKQMRRLYDRLCPEELYNALPMVGKKCYAYEFKCTTFFEEDDYNKHIKELLATPRNYALLLSKQLPALAEMPFFMNQGKIAVKVCERPLECFIQSEAQLEQLRKFHLMLFRELLEVWKNFFVLDNRNKENSFLLVPLKSRSIDWSLVESFQHLPPQRKYNMNERQQKIYRPEDYLGRVINKWYSHTESERYVVTKVCQDMSPLSAFDSENYQTYASFVESKYGTEIGRVMQRDQFLVEVKVLTSRRNFFVNAVGKTATVNRTRNRTIHLIPELCHNFMYPGDLWLKALLLPSILHRIHFMLHAEALRVRINRFLGIKMTNTYSPKALIIDTSLKRAVDYDGNATEELEAQKIKYAPVPPKLMETHFEVRSLEQEALWKDYMEPIDFSRQTHSLYPVELDYYHNFVQGLAVELDALQLNDDDEWSANQLGVAVPKHAPGTANAASLGGVGTLSISDVPLADKRRITILERSLNQQASTSSEELCSAEQFEFLAAITAAGANDVFDMERLEVLGDSFLKFSISLYLVNKFPNWHEGFYTEVKSKLVSNRNLVYCMLESDIPERICAALFKPNHEWMPPLVSLPCNVLEQLVPHLSGLSDMLSTELYALELSEADILNSICSTESLESLKQNCFKQQELVAGGIDMLDIGNDMNTFINKEVMADKTVADTLEALLGVCVKNYGIHQAFRMLEFFRVCQPQGTDKSLNHLLDLQLGSPLLRTNISVREVDGFLINHQHLEHNLGYTFRDRAYLLQALTHPSYPTNRLTGCYQQLEFIGDAILDFLVTCYIFERYGNLTPGMLTDLRSALVNNITLGCVCVRFRFHLFLLAENSALAEAIKNFANFQHTQNYRVTDQVRILMEEQRVVEDDNPCFNLSVNVEVPKVLGDIVEALIAAVYLDSRDLVTTWHVIYHLLEQELNEFSLNVPKDPVRQLYEHKFADPKFSDPIVEEDVVMMKCIFTCLEKSMEVNGFGGNAKQAKKSAAKHALQLLAKHAT